MPQGEACPYLAKEREEWEARQRHIMGAHGVRVVAVSAEKKFGDRRSELIEGSEKHSATKRIRQS